MTVSYQYQVASSTSGGFTRLLLMWRGSLYKLIYRELFLFLLAFGALSAVYRLAFTPDQKKEFEKVVIYCDTFIKLIPLSFVLGFYVSYVAQRWWKQYKAIPWPDKVMHLVALYVTGNDEYGRMLRRALMRYLNLSLILVLRSISSAVKRRFPTLDHVVDSGFMTPLELHLYESVPSVEFNTYWIPCTWFVNLLKEARRSHRLPDPQGLKLIMEEFGEFRTKCGLLWSYDWVSIPLVYTQVVTLATYTFFAVALVGRQYIDGAEKQFQLKIDIYLPVFTILQFFFFMGLLKVAEQLINPFGDDDEDFELNWLIDRHTKVSYLGVDTLLDRCPPLVKDIYFDSEDLTLPYTEAAAGYKRKTYRGSVANMMVPEEKQTMFLPDIMEEEETVKEVLTPRTSTLNIAARINDSPADERRQISRAPQTPQLSRKSSETTVQMDLSESPTDIEQVQQRRVLVEAVKRFSALAKSSTPKSDPNRKTFFHMTKTPKVVLQPWTMSSPGLTRPMAQIIDTPVIGDGDMNPWCGHASRIVSTDTLQVPGLLPCQEVEDTEEGFVNTAFSQDQSDNDHTLCDCNSDNTNVSDAPHSDVCQHRCRHRRICQHVELPDKSDSISIDDIRPRLSTRPKYLVRRHRSVGESCRRKGNRWKQLMEAKHMKVRRRTVDNVPTLRTSQEVQERVLPWTKSSPNLRVQHSVESRTDEEASDEGEEISKKFETTKL